MERGTASERKRGWTLIMSTGTKQPRTAGISSLRKKKRRRRGFRGRLANWKDWQRLHRVAITKQEQLHRQKCLQDGHHAASVTCYFPINCIHFKVILHNLHFAVKYSFCGPECMNTAESWDWTQNTVWLWRIRSNCFCQHRIFIIPPSSESPGKYYDKENHKHCY